MLLVMLQTSASATNSEARARAMCEIDLRARGFSEDKIAAAVDRFWPVLAWEIEAGSFSASERFTDEARADFEALTREYRRLING